MTKQEIIAKIKTKPHLQEFEALFTTNIFGEVAQRRNRDVELGENGNFTIVEYHQLNDENDFLDSILPTNDNFSKILAKSNTPQNTKGKLGNSIFKFEQEAGIDSKLGNWSGRKYRKNAEEDGDKVKNDSDKIVKNDIAFSQFASNILNQNSDIKIARLKEFYDQIIKGNGELLGVTDYIKSIYVKLLNFKVPQKGLDRLKEIGGNIQYIRGNDDRQSKLVNMDYFSVRIDKMPSFINDNPGLDVNVLYKKIRKNFLTLSKGSAIFESNCRYLKTEGKWEFKPYPKNPKEELRRWENELNFAIFKIEAKAALIKYGVKINIPEEIGLADHGAVLESENESFQRSWIFSTIVTPESGTQPFSGHRQFGIHKDKEGYYRFFARAIDRVWVEDFISGKNGKECSVLDYLTIADATWNNLIKNVSKFISDNGGKTTIMPNEIKRIDFNIFFKKFRANKPVIFVGNVEQYKEQ
ncbi:MAG: hypothetical protein JST62_03480 [Bacteroidetes bacterium]|jgi:hypothetical protein|nr:hypothetical protein [Bacteroidota bacterium]